jgi:outer membrane protein TolC
VEQLLFDGGRQGSTATAAALQRDMTDMTRDEVAAGLVVAATETFGRVVAAQSSLQAARANLTAAREDLTRAERRRDVGVATDADVLSLKVHVADVEQRAIQAEGRAAVSRAELNRLMGLPVDHGFLAVEPAEVSATGPPDLPALLAQAEAARPDLRRAAMAEEAADVSRRRARSALIPQVAAQAAFDVSGTEFDDRATSWIVGGEVRWTFSTGGAEVAESKAAAHAAARARAEREDLRAAVHVDVVRALRGLEEARARLAAGRAAVEEARESHRIIRDRFEAGVAGVNDVLRASTAVLDAETNRTSALVDAIVNQAMLDRALGRTP